MKNIYNIIVLCLLQIILIGCSKKNENNDNFSTNNHGTVTVITYTPVDITDTEATCGAVVTSDDINYLLEIGICWDTVTKPTINSNYISTKHVDEPFYYTIRNLNNATTYYVRAYALYGSKYYYGSENVFITNYDNFNTIPSGALRGLFSVSNNKKVFFSKGNLQYKSSSDVWQFANNQWDYIGEDNVNISSTYDGWIDLFGWGTSGWDCGNMYYRPYDSDSQYLSSYFGPFGEHDLNGLYINSDWGYYNNISNGGNIDKQWRTLNIEEWDYLLNIRNTNSGIRYAKARLNNVNGLIIVPDNWKSSIYELHEVNNKKANFESNIISTLIWDNIIQTKGVVFLPASGYRHRRIQEVYEKENKLGVYWSTSYESNSEAHMTKFDVDNVSVLASALRSYGLSVRLVQDYQ